MLTYLSLDHLALIQSLSLSFSPGFTVITGQTGSGKSMLFQAISLILGGKATPQHLSPNADLATLEAHFAIAHNLAAKTWLEEQGMAACDTLCITRTLKRKGRSSQSINGKSVLQSDLKALGEHLVCIQSQHDHLTITQPRHTLQMLDTLGNLQAQAATVSNDYQAWHAAHKALQMGLDPAKQEARATLLRHYLDELDALSPQTGEWQQLTEQHNRIQKHLEIEQALGALSEQLSGEHTALLDDLYGHIKTLKALPLDERLKNLKQSLEDATALLKEVQNDLAHYQNSANDPEAMSLEALEARISLYHNLARKHQVKPEHLVSLGEKLQSEHNQIERVLQDADRYAAEEKTTAQTWLRSATELDLARQATIAELLKHLKAGMRELGMPYAQCHLERQANRHDTPEPYGTARYQLWISTNPDQPMQPLEKVASGGERSRIALVLQSMLHQHQPASTLIFDEADTGISGEVAHQVGCLLRTIAQNGQVLCITHLPQVAAMGEQHIAITKTVSKQKTEVKGQVLTQKMRQEAIASMITHQSITDAALAQAQALLEAQS